MPKLLHIALCVLLASTVTGCGLVFKPMVQQGNLLDKKKVDQLKLDMTKRQVIALLGTPMVSSPFDHDCWDYVQANVSRHKGMTRRRLTLYFDNDTLKRTEGKFFTTPATQLLEQAKSYKSSPADAELKGDKSYDNDGSGAD